MHCFDLSDESEANEVTVASFNPMLEFMTSHHQSSSTSSGDDSEDTASVVTLVNNNTTFENNNAKNNNSNIDDQGLHSSAAKKKKKILEDSFLSKHLINSSSFGSELLQQPQGSIVSDDALGVGPNNHFEFVVEKIFTDYKNLFQKEYKDPKEHVKRKDIFRHNLR